MRLNKDMLAGAMFFAVGVVFLIASRAYEFGTIRHMGPAYFPFVLALVLMGLGVLVAVAGWAADNPVDGFSLKPLALIIGSTFLFAALLRGVGLPIAVFVLTLVSAYASRRFRVMPAILLAIGLAVSSAVIFITLLGLPLPMIGDWIG